METKAQAHARQVAEKLAAKEAARLKMWTAIKNHPVGVAVEPLLKAAVERAEIESRRYVDKLVNNLEQNGWDMNIVAPYPESNLSTSEYHKALSLYKAYAEITRAANPMSSFIRRSQPNIRVISLDGIASFIDEDKRSASFNYEAFQAKLVQKVGECQTAVLDGNHVWSFSLLTVTKADGTVQKWKTQTIVNRSVYGKYFNQYPSRVVK